MKPAVHVTNPINPTKTIHFFTKGDRNSASSRQRGYNIADRLAGLGLKCIVHQPFINLLNKTKWPHKAGIIVRLIKCLQRVKPNDVIYLQRTVYSNYFIAIVLVHQFFYKIKLVFDFDDAIFFHFPKQMKRLTRNADLVIVGSHKLEQWAIQHNNNVKLIPTAIDFPSYSKYAVRYVQHDFITVGWIGHGPDNYENLELLAPVLQECTDRNLKIRLLVIGSLKSEKVKSLFNNIYGIKVDFIDTLDWAVPDVIPNSIQAFDIGVMPLVNSEWNEGKCSFKAIECMALGIPVVISAIGENNYLISDGENGFTATGTADWFNKIEQLANCAALREKIGLCGQETIKKQYAYHVVVPELYTLLQAL